MELSLSGVRPSRGQRVAVAILNRMSPYVFHLLRRTPLVGDAMLRLIDLWIPLGTLRSVRIRAGQLEGMVMEMYPHALDMAIGRHEPLVADLIQRHLTEGDIAFDIGANVGYFTLLMARGVGPGGHVVAFEPDPLVVEYLRGNVAGNEARLGTSIDIANAAVGGVSESRPFTPGSRISRGRLGSEPGPLMVDVVTLGAAIERYGTPQLIKIDVEGAESELLDGATDCLTKLKSTIIIEAHSEQLERRCLDLLRRSGFRCERMRQRGTKETYILATK